MKTPPTGTRCQFCGIKATAIVARLDGTPTPFCDHCLAMAGEEPSSYPEAVAFAQVQAAEREKAWAV